MVRIISARDLGEEYWELIDPEVDGIVYEPELLLQSGQLTKGHRRIIETVPKHEAVTQQTMRAYGGVPMEEL